MFNKTGLVAPYSGNAGDGNASVPETTAEEIREQIDTPVRNARTGALRDCVTYLTDNAVNGAGHNVRAAINIRYNLPWIVVDELINEARPLVEREIEKVNAMRAQAEKEQMNFENLTGLFAKPVRVQKEGDNYVLSGLTESQLRSCADILGATE